MRKDLRATWSQALLTFLAPVFLVACVRWLLFEPFVIPSGSMIPTLLIYDHIFVNKLKFGIHVPFGHSFIWQWDQPEKKEIVVFRYPSNPDVYFVKRVAAVAGDEVSVVQGEVFINGQKLAQTEILDSEITDDMLAGAERGDFQYFRENEYVIRYKNKDLSDFSPVQVPEKHFFVIGDNRDQSSDSRFWGFIPEENLIGTAKMIWLSCDRTLPSAQFLCDPQAIRWNRLFTKIQ